MLRQTTIRALAGAALSLLPSVLAAQTPATLDAVLAAARRDNPDLVAARLRADSAHAERRIARAVPNPSYQASPNTPYQYGVSQLLDIGPQRLFRVRAARLGETAAVEDVADLERQVGLSVRQAFYDVLLAEAQRDLKVEERDIYRQLLLADSVRFRTGDVPERDVVKSEIEAAKADADYTRTVAATHAARIALQQLMGVMKPDTAFRVEGSLAYRDVPVLPDSLRRLAHELRPDARAARERVAQSRASLSLAKSLWVPVPTVSAIYQPGGAFATGSNWSLGYGFTVPLFDLGGGQAQKARAGLGAADVQARRVDVQIDADLANAIDNYGVNRGLAARYEGGLLEKSAGALATARYAYRQGAISLLEYLEAIRTYIDTKNDYVTAAHDYWVSVAALSAAVGREIAP